jgi:hypothetical protein
MRSARILRLFVALSGAKSALRWGNLKLVGHPLGPPLQLRTIVVTERVDAWRATWDRDRACSAVQVGRRRTGRSRGCEAAILARDGGVGRPLFYSRVRSSASRPFVALPQVGVLFLAAKICVLRPGPFAIGGLGDAAVGASAADCRSRRLFRSSEINNLANRYSSAICMRRVRHSAVSALRASSKQHSAKLSNCLVKFALIARKQRRCIEEVPGDRAVCTRP